MKIENSTFLITGGAKRIGRAIALGLAGLGANCVVHYHTSKREALDVVSQIETAGGRAVAIGQDLKDPVGLDSLIRRAEEALGPLDGLINCAAIFKRDSSTDNLKELLAEHLAVNSSAPLHLSKIFAHAFAESHDSSEMGAIINLIDSRIDQPAEDLSAYYTSKRSLYHLTKTLALELAPQIRVNGISPGAILPVEERDEAYFERMSNQLPLKRTGSVDDMIRTTQFLLVEDFITGEILKIDGGGHLL